MDVQGESFSSLKQGLSYLSRSLLDSEKVLAIVSEAAGHDSYEFLSEPKPYFFHCSELESWMPVFIVSDVLKKNLARKTFMPEVVDYVIDANTEKIIAEIPRTQ